MPPNVCFKIQGEPPDRDGNSPSPSPEAFRHIQHGRTLFKNWFSKAIHCWFKTRLRIVSNTGLWTNWRPVDFSIGKYGPLFVYHLQKTQKNTGKEVLKYEFPA